MIRVSVVTQNDKFFIPKNIKLLIDDSKIKVCSIYVVNAKGSISNKKYFFLKNFLNAGSIILSLEYIKNSFFDKLDSLFNYNIFGGLKSIESLSKFYKINYKVINNPNNEIVISDLRKLNLDFIISYSSPSIFHKRLLNTPKFSCLNLHSSLLPSYSGLMPSFWVLFYKEDFTGCTVHYMDSKIDNGSIISQKKISIDGIKSVFELNKLTKYHGGKLMIESIHKVFSGDINLIKNKVDSDLYFSWPTKTQIKKFIIDGGRLY